MKEAFSLNYKSLAFFRVLLGTLFFFDLLLVKSQNILAFYTDAGVMPRHVFIEHLQLPWKWSLFLFDGTISFSLLVFTIGFIASILFTLGYKTRLMGLICWVIVLSLHGRNSMINNGGDNLLRLLFFWSMFLPLNRYYSIDSFFSTNKSDKKHEYSLFSVALILQIVFIYLFTILYKIDSSWFVKLNSVYLAFQLDMYTTNLGEWLGQNILFTKAMNFITLIIEGLAWTLLFIPYKQQKIRMLVVLIFVAFHFGIALTMNVGIFPYSCIVAWIALLPEAFWIYISKIKNKIFNKKNITIYYDKNCGFCYKIVNLITNLLFISKYCEIKKSQENQIANDKLKKYNSWVVEINDVYYIRYKALLALIKNSIFLPLYPIFLILYPLGHIIYLYVSNHRSKISPILNIKTKISNTIQSKLLKLLHIGFVTIVFAWNIEGFGYYQYFDIRSPFNEFVRFFQLNQQWNMFAPKPTNLDAWYIVDAKLKDGSRYDIFNNQKVSFSRPKDLNIMFKNAQWQKYLNTIAGNDYSDYRLYFARYLCRKWDHKINTNDKSVHTFKIYQMQEFTPKIGEEQKTIKRRILWNHNCY